MNKSLTTVFVVTLLASTAIAQPMAGKQVEIPMPQSITVTCSDDVRPGTVVLSNPPQFSCQDYSLVKAVVGSGITIGPDANFDRISRALRRATNQNRVVSVAERRRNERNNRLVNRSKREMELDTSNGGYKSIPKTLDDFDKRFPGINRNAKFFVSDTSSCRGWVNVQKILNGECKEVKVRVQ